jgi:rhodanese-related sulfurtransferase
MAAFPKDTAFVVYCAGPHCNGANKAAIRLARLGYRVKEMIGGITGWRDEDFALERDADANFGIGTLAVL